MNPNPAPEERAFKLRLALIAAALLGGELLFGITVAVLHATGFTPPGAVASLPLGPAFLAIGAVTLTAALVLRPPLRRRIAEALESERNNRRMVAFILPMAILEVGVFFNLLTWLLVPEAYLNAGAALGLFLVSLTFLPVSDGS